MQTMFNQVGRIYKRLRRSVLTFFIEATRTGVKMESSKDRITLIICLTLIVITIIGSVAYFNINDRKLMSTNIADAVSKGMDPLSVRCSYASSMDTVCIAYAASGKK